MKSDLKKDRKKDLLAKMLQKLILIFAVFGHLVVPYYNSKHQKHKRDIRQYSSKKRETAEDKTVNTSKSCDRTRVYIN